MKLFHTEGQKEAVYVQMQDMMCLSRNSQMVIPSSITSKVFKGVTIVNDDNRFEFVRFEDEAEVKFFKDIDFIIDFDQYKNLTDKQLNEEIEKLEEKAEDITYKWNSMTEGEKKENKFLCDEYYNTQHKKNFLCEIYGVKHGKRVMPFPAFVELPEQPKKKSFFKWRRM